MSRDSKIILFECNELPYQVVDRYIHHNPDSHVARIFAASKQFETVCEDQVELDPWISWPTLHRGVIDEQHRIFHLGQSLEQANSKFPPIWQLLADQGISVGIMGSLHTSTPPESVARYSFYVPDVFSESAFAHPPELVPFQAFNLAMTRRSARNVDTSVAWGEALKFLAGYIFRGMSFSTLRGTVSELLGELRAPHLKCRRRAVQPMITLDIFLREMHKSRPGFATIHSNHVAAAMHRFWAAAFPEDIKGNEMPGEWLEKYSDEIDYAMRVFDMMIGRLLAFVERHPEYKLLIASSLGQAAVKSGTTKGFFTITDLDRFMAQLGLPAGQWSQRFAMVPCLSVIVADEHADAFEARLASMRTVGHQMVETVQEIAPLSYSRTGSSFQLFFYFDGHTGPHELQIEDGTLSFSQMGLGFYEHQDDVACSARHTPYGILSVFDPVRPTASVARTQISTLDVSPALLNHFGIEPPKYMNAADSSILATSVVGSNVRLKVTGGGVEIPVSRISLASGNYDSSLASLALATG